MQFSDAPVSIRAGDVISVFVVKICAGTMISVPDGDVGVEVDNT